MSESIIKRSSQVVSTADLSRKFAHVFSRLSNGEVRMLIVKRDQPVAVLVDIAAYEEQMHELESLRSRIARIESGEVSQQELKFST